jgi:hypothetical protein
MLNPIVNAIPDIELSEEDVEISEDAEEQGPSSLPSPESTSTIPRNLKNE